MLGMLEAVNDSFNRYMVECEFRFLLDVTFRNQVLIDTWWNVNFPKFVIRHFFDMVLIDTWWNVN